MVKFSTWRKTWPTEGGFTLIETIVVMAISSAMLLIVFTGQRSLRSRSQFDAAVDKVVATVADAHNQATAGVNTLGGGNGTSSCAGGGSTNYVFAGVAWTADNSVAGGPIKIDYYKADPGVAACIFQTQVLNLPSTIQVNATNPPATQGARILFVRNDTGGLYVCPVINLTTNVAPTFQSGSCSSGSVTLTFTDADGHTSQVLIDPSGLARRQN